MFLPQYFFIGWLVGYLVGWLVNAGKVTARMVYPGFAVLITVRGGQ